MLSLTCEKDWSLASFLGVSVQNHSDRSKAYKRLLPGCDWDLCFFHRVREFRRERDQCTPTLSNGPEMSHWPTLVGHNCLRTKCQSFASEGLRIISRLMSCSLNCILMCFLPWVTEQRCRFPQSVCLCGRGLCLWAASPMKTWRSKGWEVSHPELMAVSQPLACWSGSRLSCSVSNTPSKYLGGVASEI